MAEITLERLTKVYPDGTEAVSDLNLDVATGEFVVFVGPSGCGKTTALRMIAGLETITSGNVMLDGQVINDLPPKDKDIAMVFQNYALYPHMDAAKNMGFALRMRGLPKEIDSRVREAARISASPTRCTRSPARSPAANGSAWRWAARSCATHRRSHGRAALEPRREAAGGDARGDRAAATRPRGDDDLRDPRPDRGDDDGRSRGRDEKRVSQQIAVPKTLYERPRNLFVAEFIGSPAMNLAVADVEMSDATSGSRSGLTGCASSRRHSSATRASRPTTGERSCSGSARGHGGRRDPA